MLILEVIYISFLKNINKIISNTTFFSFLCLCLILVLLLATTTASLFSPLEDGSSAEKLDVVLRTSLSSIFGYIISSASNEKKEIVQEKTICTQNKSVQIVMVAFVCIYCLIITLICRTFSASLSFTTSSIATITQYRDFICSGIGALIGLSKSGN